MEEAAAVGLCFVSVCLLNFPHNPVSLSNLLAYSLKTQNCQAKKAFSSLEYNVKCYTPI